MNDKVAVRLCQPCICRLQPRFINLGPRTLQFLLFLKFDFIITSNATTTTNTTSNPIKNRDSLKMSAPLLFQIAGGVFCLLPIGHTQMANDVVWPGLKALGGTKAAYSSKVSWTQANGYFIISGVLFLPRPGKQSDSILYLLK